MHQVAHQENIVEVRNVSFFYGQRSEDQRPILSNINLDIHKGDYLGIVGPNGGGKTTLLRIMLGLLTPTKGEVKLFGQSISSFREWGSIGYVPQHVVRFDHNFPVTVRDVVAMGLYGKIGLFKSLSKQDDKRIIESLEKVGMADYKDTLIGNLSGGQQQRVFIGRALVSDPKILFLDEPTIGIDVQAQERFYGLLRTLNRKYDITLVLATHELDIISHEATECACINQKLIYHGTPKDFMEGKHIEQLYGKEMKFIRHH